MEIEREYLCKECKKWMPLEHEHKPVIDSQNCQKCGEPDMYCRCKPTHTPTPWHVEHTDDGYIRINNENGDIPVEDSGNGRHPLTVSMDDAAFIVTAVNAYEPMLEAFREINGILSNGGDIRQAIFVASKAIAAAEWKGE